MIGRPIVCSIATALITQDTHKTARNKPNCPTEPSEQVVRKKHAKLELKLGYVPATKPENNVVPFAKKMFSGTHTKEAILKQKKLADADYQLRIYPTTTPFLFHLSPPHVIVPNETDRPRRLPKITTTLPCTLDGRTLRAELDRHASVRVNVRAVWKDIPRTRGQEGKKARCKKQK